LPPTLYNSCFSKITPHSKAFFKSRLFPHACIFSYLYKNKTYPGSQEPKLSQSPNKTAILGEYFYSWINLISLVQELAFFTYFTAKYAYQASLNSKNSGILGFIRLKNKSSIIRA